MPPHMQHSQSQQGHIPTGPHGHAQQTPQMGMVQHFGGEQMQHTPSQGPPTGPPVVNANMPPYGSPAATHVQMMYPGYAPPGPGGPQFRYSYGGHFAPQGGPGMHMIPGQPPMHYMPAGVGSPFMGYGSPSQAPAYPVQGGPPPPTSQGFPSPRRPVAAPM